MKPLLSRKRHSSRRRLQDQGLWADFRIKLNLCVSEWDSRRVTPNTTFTRSKAPSPHARKPSTPSFRIAAWGSYPERNLRAAGRQTHMPERCQHQISDFRVRQLPGTFFTQRARRQTHMPGRRQHQISHLCVRQLPGAFFLHREQGVKPTCQEDVNAKFRISACDSCPEHFVHREQGAKPACQEGVYTKICPNTNARKTPTPNCSISAWDSYPEHTLQGRKTRMPGRHQRLIFASPNSPEHKLCTQQGAKPAYQEDVDAKFSHLHVDSCPEHNLRAARRKTGVPGRCRRRVVHLLMGKLARTPSPHVPRPACRAKAADARVYTTPERTSDALQAAKRHACHAKAAERRPKPHVHQTPSTEAKEGCRAKASSRATAGPKRPFHQRQRRMPRKSQRQSDALKRHQSVIRPLLQPFTQKPAGERRPSPPSATPAPKRV